jgi:hypothetical protein
MMLDRNELAVDRAEQALRAAAGGRDTEVIANALVSQGSAIGFFGRLDEAEALMRGAMVLADREGHIAAALRARNNLVSILIADAPMRAMLPLLNESVDMALRFGLGGWGAQHLTLRAWAAWSIGEWDQARADLDYLADWTLSDLHIAWRATALGALAAATGNRTEAESQVVTARERLQHIDTLPQVTSIAGSISLMHILLGEWSAALDAMAGMEGGGNDAVLCMYGAFAAAAAGDREQVAAVAKRTNTIDEFRVANTTRRQVAASVAATGGRWEEARAAYAAAVAEYRALDLNLEAAVLSLEFASYLGDRFDDARAAGEAAEVWFAERNATSVVDQYRAAFGGSPAPPAGGVGARKQAVPVDAEQPA